MTSKVDIFNAALAATGNNAVSDHDGSDEWDILDANYALIVSDCFEEVEPNFGMVWRHSLTGRFNGDTDLPDAYTLPTNLLAIRSVYVNDIFWPEWRSDNSTLWIDGDSGVEIDYVREASEAQWSGKFRRAVQMYLEAVCYRGLNSDETEAERRELAAERMLLKAGAKSSQQRSPERTYQRSRLMLARRGARRFYYGTPT
jgi:hypothetical protein